jgi:sentrin-specific protease 1
LHREEDEVRRQKEREVSKKEEVIEALLPLSDEAEQAVENALYNGSRNEVLAFHEETNIEVTRAIMQCLVPGAWLNDEVINVYMQLLKERENRSPDKFLKCHFFNTFFYNKLFKDKRSYDYKSVRRWTTQRKIGYSLADCDKILVPIHQDIHWCLAVINLRDQKFEYLDSLNGRDENVLRVLARYLVDEAKDKNNSILDVSKWESVFPQDIPEQLNGCDCGMFMLKYADFHSRGGSLSFTQADMEYFRKRTVYEILRVEAS